jgi:tetratricopeptide (TPR) repeat protein
LKNRNAHKLAKEETMRYLNLQLLFLLLLIVCSAHAQEPRSADDFSQRGISRFEKNDLEGAIADFTKAIELNGNELGYCFYFRGMALYRLGRLDEAIADLSKAITLKSHARFYGDRGNLLAQRGDFDGAIADLNKAIEIEPKFAKAYGDRGIVRLMRGEEMAAESDFKKCFELDQTLESQITRVANHIRQRAVLRTEHQAPADVEIVKFSWTETPSRKLDDTPSAPVSVSTTPVSRTGLRVLGGMEKGESGPAVGGNEPATDPFDPLAPPLAGSRGASARFLGVDYKFTASIKNTGSKTIVAVNWAYLVTPQGSKDGYPYVFTTKTNLPPGKTKELRDQVESLVFPADPSRHNRAQFKESVVILRLDYADGTSWRSSKDH